MDEKEYLAVVEELQALTEQYLMIKDPEKRREIMKKSRELTKRIEQYELECEIEEFLDSMRSSGAISLKDQEIKVHKNGAKITIPSTYLKDGILDDKKKYTLLFIPK